MAQTPVRYRVTTAPTRCAAVYTPPYSIINLSTNANAVAWIADNAGLQTGAGTPLYPGASFVWQKPGDFWVIGESEFDIVVSSDAVDWDPNPIAIATAILNSGVLLVDQPVVVFNGALTAGNSTPNLDLSRYQSMVVRIFPTTANLNQRLGIRYTSAGLTMNYDVSAITAGWQGTLPVLGSTVQFTAFNGAFDVVVVASNRPYRSTQDLLGNPNANFFVTGTLLTATFDTWGIPAYFGELQFDTFFHLSAASPIAATSMQLLANQNGTYRQIKILQAFIAFTGATQDFQSSTRQSVQGDEMRVLVVNNTAVTLDYTLHVTPTLSQLGTG